MTKPTDCTPVNCAPAHHTAAHKAGFVHYRPHLIGRVRSGGQVLQHPSMCPPPNACGPVRGFLLSLLPARKAAIVAVPTAAATLASTTASAATGAPSIAGIATSYAAIMGGAGFVGWKSGMFGEGGGPGGGGPGWGQPPAPPPPPGHPGMPSGPPCPPGVNVLEPMSILILFPAWVLAIVIARQLRLSRMQARG
jgi:hypothetical protein